MPKRKYRATRRNPRLLHDIVIDENSLSYSSKVLGSKEKYTDCMMSNISSYIAEKRKKKDIGKLYTRQGLIYRIYEE